jgi:hypothetical protein
MSCFQRVFRPRENFDTFELHPIKSLLTQFFNGKIKSLSSKSSLSEAEWHLTKRCNGCQYLQFCTAQAERAKDLSLLRQFTQPRKKFLFDFLKKLEQSSTFDKVSSPQRTGHRTNGISYFSQILHL